MNSTRLKETFFGKGLSERSACPHFHVPTFTLSRHRHTNRHSTSAVSIMASRTGKTMPTLLLDKSAFQALGVGDLERARQQYQLLATDVLLLEILGDTRHEDGRSASFSRKLRMADAVVNMPSHLIATSELLGEAVPMNQVAVLRAVPVRSARGEPGVVVEPSEGDEALYRWSRGEFNESDDRMADEWVRSTRAFDLGFFERGVRTSIAKGLAPGSLEGVMALIDGNFADSSSQANLLDSYLEYLPVAASIKTRIRERWEDGSLRLLRDAPYTSHCLRVLYALFMAVGSRLVGTRSTNFVDAQYFMYLPFCSHFTSGDAVHTLLFPHLRSEGQTLLSPSELRELLG